MRVTPAPRITHHMQRRKPAMPVKTMAQHYSDTMDAYDAYFDRCEAANRVPLSFEAWLQKEGV